jgi:CBS-domain-containing membrane protein
MTLGSIEGTLWGCFGGFAAYVFGTLRLTQERPDKIIEWFFKKEVLIASLIIAIFQSILGGLVCFAYIRSGHSFDTLLAINIGATAPLIFTSVASKTPVIEPSDKIKSDDS